MATKTIDFNETSISTMYPAYIKDARSMFMPQTSIGELYRSIFNTIATFLKYQRNKNKPHIGFKLMNEAGEFRVGAILDFHAPEGESDDTGNWTLSFTLHEEDMNGLDEVYDNFSDMFFTVANQEAMAAMNAQFTTNEYATFMISSAFEVLKNQLDDLSDKGEDVEITMPGIFMAGVGYENGERVYYIVPGHNIKQLIKDDKGLSKDNVVKLHPDTPVEEVKAA